MEGVHSFLWRHANFQSRKLQNRYKATTGNGACARLSTCQTGFFQDVPPSLYSDRVCRKVNQTVGQPCFQQPSRHRLLRHVGLPYMTSLRPPHIALTRLRLQVSDACAPTEFLALAAAETHDRICRSCAACAAAGAENVTCDAAADSSCGSCAACPEEHYVSHDCGAVGERQEAPSRHLRLAPAHRLFPFVRVECMSCQQCTDDEYEEAPCTQLSARECRPLTMCVFDSIAATAGAVFFCASAVAHSFPSRSFSCPPGYFESTPPTPTTDRVCTKVTSCKSISQHYERVPATATSNAVCESLLLCGPGAIETSRPTVTSDRYVHVKRRAMREAGGEKCSGSASFLPCTLFAHGVFPTPSSLADFSFSRPRRLLASLLLASLLLAPLLPPKRVHRLPGWPDAGAVWGFLRGPRARHVFCPSLEPAALPIAVPAGLCGLRQRPSNTMRAVQSWLFSASGEANRVSTLHVLSSRHGCTRWQVSYALAAKSGCRLNHSATRGVCR